MGGGYIPFNLVRLLGGGDWSEHTFRAATLLYIVAFVQQEYICINVRASRLKYELPFVKMYPFIAAFIKKVLVMSGPLPYSTSENITPYFLYENIIYETKYPAPYS